MMRATNQNYQHSCSVLLKLNDKADQDVAEVFVESKMRSFLTKQDQVSITGSPKGTQCSLESDEEIDETKKLASNIMEVKLLEGYGKGGEGRTQRVMVVASSSKVRANQNIRKAARRRN